MTISFGVSGIYGQVGAQRLLGGLMHPPQPTAGQFSPAGGRFPAALADLPSPDTLPHLMPNLRPLAPTMLAALLLPARDHEPTTTEQAGALLEQADADGDGGLNGAEVRLALRLDPDGPEAGLQAIDTAFARLDLDANGRLDRPELESGLGGLGRNPDPPLRVLPGFVSLLVHDADADGDGRVSADDLIARLGPGADRAALDTGIARWDLDDDGGLSVDELQMAAVS